MGEIQKMNGVMLWEEDVEALEGRFGQQGHKNPMSELLKLRQTGNVSTYHDQFEFWLGRIDIFKEYAVSFYLNGLKPIIQ